MEGEMKGGKGRGGREVMVGGRGRGTRREKWVETGGRKEGKGGKEGMEGGGLAECDGGEGGIKGSGGKREGSRSGINVRESMVWKSRGSEGKEGRKECSK